MQAEIITIGDEILIGQIVDTNSAYISKALNKIGVSVYQITSIQDDKEHILKALKEAEENADIVIITGGLGPTKDDITKHTICEYFKDTLIKNEDVLDQIEYLFKTHINTPISDLNRNQALVPSKAIILKNRFGTAPGMLFEKNDKTFVSLPGVPYEMKNLLSLEVLPILQKKYKCPYIIHKTILTYGLGESAVANRLEKWENNLPKHIKLAYLPNLGRVRLRLSSKGFDKIKIDSDMSTYINELLTYVNDIFVGFEEDGSLEAIVGQLLLKNNHTLATAESCSGGNIARLITSVPGASQYFAGSVVSYNERIKSDILQVQKSTIKNYSVVSGEVVKEMAMGIKKLFNTDYAIAVTGNAGPTKDKTDKKLGVVFIGIATPNSFFMEEFNFGQPREKVIQKASIKSLELLRKELLKNI